MRSALLNPETGPPGQLGPGITLVPRPALAARALLTIVPVGSCDKPTLLDKGIILRRFLAEGAPVPSRELCRDARRTLPTRVSPTGRPRRQPRSGPSTNPSWLNGRAADVMDNSWTLPCDASSFLSKLNRTQASWAVHMCRVARPSPARRAATSRSHGSCSAGIPGVAVGGGLRERARLARSTRRSPGRGRRTQHRSCLPPVDDALGAEGMTALRRLPEFRRRNA